MGASLTASRVQRPLTVKETFAKLKADAESWKYHKVHLRGIVIDEETGETIQSSMDDAEKIMTTLVELESKTTDLESDTEFQAQLRSACKVMQEPHIRDLVLFMKSRSEAIAFGRTNQLNDALQTMHVIASQIHAPEWIRFVRVLKPNKKQFPDTIETVRFFHRMIQNFMKMAQDNGSQWKERSKELYATTSLILQIRTFNSLFPKEAMLSEVEKVKLRPYAKMVEQFRNLFVEYDDEDPIWHYLTIFRDNLESLQILPEGHMKFVLFMLMVMNFPDLALIRGMIGKLPELNEEQKKLCRMVMEAEEMHGKEMTREQFLDFVEEKEAEASTEVAEAAASSTSAD